jgi:hypothetical protein
VKTGNRNSDAWDLREAILVPAGNEQSLYHLNAIANDDTSDPD